MLIETLPEYKAENSIKITKTLRGNDVSPFGAFRQKDPVCLNISVDCRAGAYDFAAEFIDDDTEISSTVAFTRSSGFSGNELWSLFLPTEKESLYFYKIRYRDENGLHFVKNPLTDTEDFQLTVFDGSYTPPSWFRGGTMYHIFVDRFAKSGICAPKPYAKMADNLQDTPQYAEKPGAPLANDLFFGGDLYGIKERLDYLSGLGVTCIYLSPIFDARSNHKYDTGDYLHVDSMFGGDRALEALIEAARSKNIRIILDGVFNHTGDDSIYFNKYGNYDSTGAYQSPDSPYADWYSFRSYPDEYESWWGIPILPTTNKESDGFRNFIFGTDGIVPHYLKKGIAGWRLDVADELPEKFLCDLTKSAKNVDKEALIIGEVWEDASNKISYSRRRKYFRGNELDSVMNYPWRNAVIDFVKHGGAEQFKAAVLTLYEHYPKCVSDNLMNILGTHDTERILTVLGADSANGYTNAQLAEKKMTAAQRRHAVCLLKLAYTIIATLPGVPCIYYGDEAGMEGYGDPFNRRFFPWGEEDRELIDYYRKIGSIRRQESVFREGILTFDLAQADVVVYRRDSLLIAVNRGNAVKEIPCDAPYYDLLTDTVFSGSLPPTAAVICKPANTSETDLTYPISP